MIKRILRRILPAGVYGVGKARLKRFRVRRQLLKPKIGEDAMRRILVDELRLVRGDIVFVHSSVDALNLDFPFFKLLGMLREVVGAEGTLLFPATQLTERPETWLAGGQVFDLKRSPTSMGLLAEWARRQRGSERSMHPTHSVVAQGPLAVELLGEHHWSPAPCGVHSPYYKMLEKGGVVVGLGVDADVLTMVHCVEDVLGGRFPVQTRRSELYSARVLDMEGHDSLVKTAIGHPRMRFRRMLDFMACHIDGRVCRRLQVEGVPFYRVEAKPLYESMMTLAQRGVTIYWRSIHRQSPFETILSYMAEKLEAR